MLNKKKAKKLEEHKQLIKQLNYKLINNSAFRVEYFKHDFFRFCLYYFSNAFFIPSASFHKEYCNLLQSGINILFDGFRESGKTLFLKYKFIHNILYKNHNFMIFFCYDKKKAEAKLFDIAIQLQINNKIIRDFGQVFFCEFTKEKKSQRKTIGEFITENNIKVKAMGIGESVRGELYGNEEGEFRPTFIGLDDIDTNKSTTTRDVIDKNYFFFKNEILGGIGDNSQIVFLYNTIREDGVGVRLREDYKNNPRRTRRRIYFSEEKNPRPQKLTKPYLKMKLEDQGTRSFQQNYLGVADKDGSLVIKRNRIKYHSEEIFDRIYIGIDPAFSKKTNSDSIGIVVTGIIKKDRPFYYILESLELKGEDKRKDVASKIILSIYNKHNANLIIVEKNNGGDFFADELKDLYLPVFLTTAKTDKLTRLLEFEASFERGEISFSTSCNPLIDQLLSFTGHDSNKDDLVDAMVHSFGKNAYQLVVFSA